MVTLSCNTSVPYLKMIALAQSLHSIPPLPQPALPPSQSGLGRNFAKLALPTENLPKPAAPPWVRRVWAKFAAAPLSP